MKYQATIVLDGEVITATKEVSTIEPEAALKECMANLKNRLIYGRYVQQTVNLAWHVKPVSEKLFSGKIWLFDYEDYECPVTICKTA